MMAIQEGTEIINTGDGVTVTTAATAGSDDNSSAVVEPSRGKNMQEMMMMWSNVLATPSSNDADVGNNINGDLFSPSARPIGDKDCLHGVGLQKALDHGTMTSRSGKRCALMLLEGANCYEQFSVSLMKVCQQQQQQQQDNDSSREQGCYRMVESLSQQSKVLSTKLREEIGMPMQGFHTTMGETLVPSMQQKYVQSRQKANGTRSRALAARIQYLRAVNDAEQACIKIQEAVGTSVVEEQQEQKEDKQQPAAAGSSSGEDGIVDNDTATTTAAEESNITTKADSWEKTLEEYGKLKGQPAVDRVNHLLNEVRIQKRRYEKLVEKENNAVRLVQRVEVVTLEGVQKVQQQRLKLFSDGLIQTLQEIKVSLDNLVDVAVVVQQEGRDQEEKKEDDDDNFQQQEVVQQQTSTTSTDNKSSNKKGGDFFSTILKVGSTSATSSGGGGGGIGGGMGEPTGVSDAETLGLEEDVGKLRDDVQKKIHSRLVRYRKVKALASLFTEVSGAATKLGNGLLQVVKHEDSFVSSKGAPIEHLRTLQSNCEGPRTLRVWKDLLKSMEREGEAFLEFAKVLGSTKAMKLDPILSTNNEKEIREMAEQDDARWKHLCDAARTELRSESKYRQSTMQTAKARERMGSVDNNSSNNSNSNVETMEGSGSSSTIASRAAKSPLKNPSRAMTGMNKAFGNFLSILPDGGEKAMEAMLSPDARRAVAEKQVAEADEKEMKVKAGWDNAVAVKNKIMAAYRTKTESIVERYQLEEITVVEDIKGAMESLGGCLKKLRTSRYEALGPLSSDHQSTAHAATLVDLDEWAEKTAKELETSNKSTPVVAAMPPTKDAAATTGFMLTSVFAESQNAKQVLQFARIRNSDSFESDCSDKDDASEASGPTTTVRVSTDNDSNRSLDLNSVKNEETSGGEVDKDKGGKDKGEATSGAKWLKKSFSSPIGKPGGFKTFRKLHSQGGDNALAETAGDDETETSTISTTIPPRNNQELSETELFALFWPDYEGTTPGVTHSFACAFLPKDCTVKQAGQIEHGRMFYSHKGAVFIAWSGKKAVMSFSTILKVENKVGLFGLADDTLLISAQSKGAPTNLLLSCFNHRDEAKRVAEERIEIAKKAQAEAEEKKKKEQEEEEAAKKKAQKEAEAKKNRKEQEETTNKAVTSVVGKQAPVSSTPVPPDPTMKKLETVLSKTLRGIPISRFHDVVWLDQENSKESFYGIWLGQGKTSNIKVGEWEETSLDGGGGFTGGWCGEKYTHKRMVNFQLKRSSMIGPPVAGVKQTQYCRVEGNDRSVMMMTVAFDSIPYSDSFTVEVRWVATRAGARDISIQVGVFVQFHKSTLLKSQIRSGTLAETKPVHESLFKYVKAALSKECTITEEEDNQGEAAVDEGTNTEVDGGETTESADNKTGSEGGLLANIKNAFVDNMHITVPVLGCMVCLFCFRSSAFGFGGDGEIARLNAKVDDLETEIRLMRQSIDQLTTLLKNNRRF